MLHRVNALTKAVAETFENMGKRLITAPQDGQTP
jgi:hypothetical protein